MAGLVPAIPIIWRHRAELIEIAGTSPAMKHEMSFPQRLRARVLQFQAKPFLLPTLENEGGGAPTGA